ncbi:ABC transporter ATP-binding protein [Desulfovibrio litoralis]|uniref:Iron complex transport system ATP-binding protein n=1 Tax=Desulfovibrio litoralis DSM 11393 TaxID=1121455 RepID=A0A1M7S7D8_9BACT|nr:ABC transporter ATP-binding protein [Desulfovibrio litoralis]SHN54262.1 iron complex transport system ATP-binding protein [Desulfovibrio litoralis DSM 11393]
MNKNILLKAEDLYLSYTNNKGVNAQSSVLKGVSLELFSGEIVGLLGPNGAGKSSLLFALVGSLALNAGKVFVSPVQNVFKESEIANKQTQDLSTKLELSALSTKEKSRLIACLNQKNTYVPSLSVAEFVLMGRYANGGLWADYSQEDYEIVLESLKECGIEKLQSKKMSELSGGELQLSFLAQILAKQTPLILLDEVSSSLDINHSINIFNILEQKKKKGASILAAIHDINLAALYCDRLIFIQDGSIKYFGRTESLFNSAVFAEIYKVNVEIFYNSQGKPQLSFLPSSVINNSGDGVDND